MKDLWFYPIFTITSLSATVLSTLARMQDFWVRDKGQFITHSISIYQRGNTRGRPREIPCSVGFMSQPGNTKFGKPPSFQANLPKICPEEKHYFTRLDSKQISSVLWRETLISKAVIQTPLKSKTKGCLWLCPAHSTCKTPMENYIPTWVITTHQWEWLIIIISQL